MEIKQKKQKIHKTTHKTNEHTPLDDEDVVLSDS